MELTPPSLVPHGRDRYRRGGSVGFVSGEGIKKIEGWEANRGEEREGTNEWKIMVRPNGRTKTYNYYTVGEDRKG